MNAKFHKAQAEELIKQFNGRDEANASHMARTQPLALLALAQVHATLATLKDEE